MNSISIAPTVSLNAAVPVLRPEVTANTQNYNIYARRMTESTVSEDPDLATLIELLDDEQIRTILTATNAEPLSAEELSDRCDVSVSTIYRRIDRLEDANLVREQTRPRPDGHHETIYASTLDRFELTIQNGEIDWTLERRQADIADELTRLWGKF